VDDGLGIAVRSVLMPASFQTFAEFLVVIKLAVVNDPDIVRFVADRLMTGLDVDNAEPAHGQSDVALNEKTVIVRTAMNNLPVHLGESIPLDSS
jgi:hypothetical protein